MATSLFDFLGGTTFGGTQQPTSPGTSIPTNPANQGTNPTKQKFNRNDLSYLYGNVDPGKTQDIDRILQGLGGANEFSLEELQSGAKTKGLSSRSKKAWEQVLQQLNQAYSGSQATSPSTSTLTGGNAPTGGGAGQPSSSFSGGSPWGDLAAYMAPTGPTGNFLNQLLGQGPNAFTPQQGGMQQVMQGLFGQGVGGLTPQTGPSQQMLQQLLGLGPQGVTPQAGETQQMLQQLLGLGPQGTTTQAGPLESLVGQLFGQGPSAFIPSAGASEQWLSNLVKQGPGNLTLPQSLGESALAMMLGNPTLNSLAGGQVPAGIQAQFEDAMNLARANTLEQFGMGGARFGSDVAEQLMRQEVQGRNSLLANTEQQALAANQLLQGGANQLGGLEQARYQPALSSWASLAGNPTQAELGRTLGGQSIFGSLASALPQIEAGRGTQGMQNFLGLGSGLGSMEANQTMQGLQNFLGLGQGLTGVESNQAMTGLQNLLGLGNNLTGLEANQSGQGMSNFLNLLGGAYSGEMNQSNNAMNMLFQEYIRNSGLPPELAALLGVGQLSSGAGTQTGTQSGGGGSLFQQIAGPLLGAGMMASGFGGLSSLFGGTQTPAGSTWV